MRRRTAATAALFAALAIGGPLAGTAAAGPTTLRCAVAAPPAACAHLDDLAAGLAPVAPLLGSDLTALVAPAQGFAARSDQPAGVPTAEVVGVSAALRDQLGSLPPAVQGLVGATVLGDLTGTLDALIAELTAPGTPTQSASGTSKPTPAKTAPSTSAPAARSTDTSSFGSSASTSPASPAPSSDAVPDVPVGDPLTLAPLGLPDFGFDQTFEPAVEASIESPALERSEALKDAVDAMAGGGRGAELAVVVVLSLLLIAGAGVAHLQAQRHTIPDV